MSRAVLLATILAIVLVMPTTIATWYAYGSYEPDSAYDDASYMWADPAPDGEHRVYFAVHTRQGTSELNPNVGLVETRIETVGFERSEALLGVWKDCNRDGYVGMLESSLREYHASLLFDDRTCPAVSGLANMWSAGAHNYNEWVTEFVPIGPRGYIGAADARYYQDDGAMVWGDHGLPDGSGQRPTCTLGALPAGGARTTGRILDHMDCYLAVMTEERSVDIHDDLLPIIGDPAGWRTNGAWAGSASPLERGTLGDAGSSNSHVTLTNCDEYPIELTGDVPVGGDLDDLRVEEINDPEVHEEGTVAGTIVYATEYVHQEGSYYNAPDSNGPCSDGVDDNRQFYGLFEGDASDVHERQKAAPDWSFRFYRAPRGTGLAGLHPVSPIDGYGGAPSDLGVEAIPSYCSPHLNYEPTFCAQTRWYAPMTVRPPPTFVKSDLIGSGYVGLADAYTLTFYARLSDATFDRGFATPGGQGAYGAQTCGENDSGIHGGWQCDAQLWYPGHPCHGDRASQYTGTCQGLPLPGTIYHLRDIDCYDGGIGDTGLYLMPAGYGERPCP